MNIILIDYESLQPADLAGLEGEDVRVLVFVGAQQNRIPFDFAEAMQQLGELTQQLPSGAFRVVSKDSGFDPLIAHLQARGFDVERCQALSAQIRDPEEQVTQTSS